MLSGLRGLDALADFEAVCEDLAINDVAELVAEVERLRADVVAWDERYTGEGQARFECAEHVERLQAENERLRAELATLREWANGESAHWDGRNADRYWQMQRVLGQLDTPAPSSAPSDTDDAR